MSIPVINSVHYHICHGFTDHLCKWEKTESDVWVILAWKDHPWVILIIIFATSK